MDANNGDTAIRRQIVNKLTTVFGNEYRDTMSRYPTDMQEELTLHLKGLMEQLAMYADSGRDMHTYTAVAEGEMALLKKHGNRLTAYWEKKFTLYFDFDFVLAEKGVFTADEYNSVPDGGQSLQPAEAVAFAGNSIRLLDVSLPYIMLQSPPDSLNGAGATEGADQAENGQGFTKARQLLAIHYLLMGGFGLGPHTGPDVSGLARLAHLLTGTPYTALQNSEIYKKYRHMPNFKKGPGLVADLLYIRSYFAALGLDAAVKLIDAEITRERREK